MILDINGKEICPGMSVKYTRTHTVGKVEKILIKDGYAWIKIDSSGLYYRNDYIEIIKYKKQDKSIKRRSKSDHFNIEIPVEISDITDGPGVGGG